MPEGLPALNVSRETEEALLHLKDLVIEWNPTINLVSKNSIGELWDRHIIDSAQIFVKFLPKDGFWVDFGTGGGFPGLVLARTSPGKPPPVPKSTQKPSFGKNFTKI